MAQYAHYDSTAPSPAPVIGWYDTDQFRYPYLPPATDLLELDASQWAEHYSNPQGFAVSSGQLVTYPPTTE
jgi:hypothetical protein